MEEDIDEVTLCNNNFRRSPPSSCAQENLFLTNNMLTGEVPKWILKSNINLVASCLKNHVPYSGKAQYYEH
ncbi:hypothetical protein CKAN_02224400 [Cinnamomum micranthum f. kanehirae]|uniref:LRR receptor-like serine/threonine-protein kinase n=1 Tax=Cinnamomum micranthum f. kanehirae TaxID=337451 RepID=A0A443PQF8_9MAGN|nr:hypothetical protein CKAN_02224400 [Cinnamomum micranthum f. kanehirae]